MDSTFWDRTARSQHTRRPDDKSLDDICDEHVGMVLGVVRQMDGQLSSADQIGKQTVPLSWFFSGSPNGIRTRVSTLRGWCPWPLDDGARLWPAAMLPERSSGNGGHGESPGRSSRRSRTSKSRTPWAYEFGGATSSTGVPSGSVSVSEGFPISSTTPACSIPRACRCRAHSSSAVPSGTANAR